MSGSIDASIPLHAGQGVTPIANPLTQYGDFVHLQSALNQNALFPGQQQLQQQAITHGDQATQDNATKLALQNRNAVYAHLAPLIAAKDPSLDLVNQALGTAAANGFNVNPTLDRLHATFPVAGTPENTPEGRRAWLQGLVGATLAPSEQVAASQPKLEGFLDTGGQKLPYFTGAPIGPNSGKVLGQDGQPFNAGKPVDLTVSPETAAKPETRVDASGNPVTAPSSTFMDPRLVPPAVRGAPSGGGSMGTGRYQQPSIPGAGGAPSQGPSLGTVEAVQEDVKRYKADQSSVPQGQTAVQSLQKAQHALELADTGRSTESFQKIYSFLTAQGFSTPGMTDDVKNWDLAHKYLLDYARQSGAAAHTDLQLQASEGSNASTGISNAAALDVVKTNIGRERQKIAQVMAAPETGVGYGKHTTQFSNDTDPRAFAYDSYSPAERKAMIAKMSPAQLEKFDHSLDLAARYQLIQVPGAKQ